MARCNRRLSGCALRLLSLAAAALVPSQALAAPRVPTHVACVGDSITYGYLASNQATKSYPANLQMLFGASVQVKNFGHNGATLLSAPFGDLPYEDQSEYAAATSFVSGAGASAVVDVILMLGTNDSKSYNWAPGGKPKNDQQFLSDYRAMVQHFSALPPKPLVFLALPLATGTNPCCSIDGTVIHDEILPLIKQVAAEKNLPTIDLNTPTTGHPEYFRDGVHPTDEAYALVAKLMHAGLLVDQSSSGGNGNGGSGGKSGSGGSAGNGASGSSAGGSSGNSVGGDGGNSAHVGGGIGAAGSAGLGSAGAPSASFAGSGSSGAPASGASGGHGGTGGGAGANAAAGSKSTAPPPDGSGCSVSRHQPEAALSSAFGWLGLAWLVARRRRRARA